MSSDVRVESGIVTWDPSRAIAISSFSSWGIPDENYEAPIISLASELKFRFIIGDRGNIYDVRTYIDLFACTNWYWEFKVHILKNFKLQLHYGHCLRVPVPASISPDIVDMTRKGLEDAFRRKIIIETIQPIDFYK